MNSKLEVMFLELKDTSEMMVDLAYSSLLYDNVEIALFTTLNFRLSSAVSSVTARSISSPTTVMPYSHRMMSSMS